MELEGLTFFFGFLFSCFIAIKGYIIDKSFVSDGMVVYRG
jgi:hypothetical protein